MATTYLFIFPDMEEQLAQQVVSVEILVRMKEMALKRLAANEIEGYWEKWEFRLMMIFSLCFQFLIIISGYVRKNKNGGAFPLVSSVVYLTYLLADLIATITLSTLLRAQLPPSKSAVVMLWTPFLLWHLGGPYNVTAYSLEDNQIWTRHLLNYGIHVGEASYICYKLGLHTNHPALRFLAVPILVAGAYKYGLRVWALRAANEKQLVDQLYFEEEGQFIKGVEWGNEETMREYLDRPINLQVRFLREAYLSFMIFRCLFFGFPARFSWNEYNRKILEDAIKERDAEAAFRVVEIELSLLYDTFYTKIPIQIWNWGLFAFGHAFYLLFTIASLLAFYFITKTCHYVYGETETFLTYVLLSGAILIETISSILHLFSTWTMVKLDEKVIEDQPPLGKMLWWIVEGKRSISMGQHDLIEQCCFKRSITSPMRTLTTFIDVNNVIRVLWNSTWVVVDADLKKYIHDHLTDPANLNHLLNQPHLESSKVIREILQRHGVDPDKLELGDTGIIDEFVNFMFVFHIATNALYYIDEGNKEYQSRSRGISKRLSDYMMYLALVRPLMLPKGIVEVLYKDTRNQVKVQHTKPSEETKSELANMLHNNLDFDHSTSIYFEDGKESNGGRKLRRSNLLEPARCISRSLRPLSEDDLQNRKQSWDTICEVWIDMLAYAAVHCTWKEHAEHLKEGGELLTHVALLMAHLGYAA